MATAARVAAVATETLAILYCMVTLPELIKPFTAAANKAALERQVLAGLGLFLADILIGWWAAR